MSTPKRFRISVPEADTSVLEWIGKQQNLSYSIRQLIRDYIEREGYTDATCAAVQQLPRRGRPPKDASERDEELAIAGANLRTPAVTTPAETPVVHPTVAQPQRSTVVRDADGFTDPAVFFGGN